MSRAGTPDYFPPGWNSQRFDTCSEEELNTLTDEEYQRIMDGITGESLALHAENRAYGLANGLLKAEDLDKTQKDRPAAFVDAIRSEGLTTWGFVVVRTDFSDSAKWMRFKNRWEEAMEDQMTPSAGTGIDEVKGDLEFVWVEEKSLEGADSAAVRKHIHGMREAGKIPEGLDWPMILVVDSAAMKSLVEAPPLRPLRDHLDPPFVIGVDMDFEPEEQDEEDRYPGEFKVGIATVLSELFPHLATRLLMPHELWPPSEGQGPAADVWMWV
ncbi:hypothetical protein FN846DRAFT_965312 [Sphaerosporella brunnea]|uniref:Uncharacterized protein n=1 Tax=Sphaerosporella brunnea TaxID=1250544 RepID=A0A5J5EL36_9PEZI|nr:hypothetical protein FN846DRAFT_965312 [Sphaerosporella brunnea]